MLGFLFGRKNKKINQPLINNVEPTAQKSGFSPSTSKHDNEQNSYQGGYEAAYPYQPVPNFYEENTVFDKPVTSAARLDFSASQSFPVENSKQTEAFSPNLENPYFEPTQADSGQNFVLISPTNTAQKKAPIADFANPFASPSSKGQTVIQFPPSTRLASTNQVSTDFDKQFSPSNSTTTASVAATNSSNSNNQTLDLDKFLELLVEAMTGYKLQDLSQQQAIELKQKCQKIFVDYILHYISQKFGPKEAVRLRSGAQFLGSNLFVKFSELGDKFEEASYSFFENLKLLMPATEPVISR